MRIKASIVAAAALLALAGSAAQATTVIGVNKVVVPPNATVVVAVNFTHPAETYSAEEELEVTSTTGTELLMAAGTLTDDQYKGGLYYVRMTAGGAKGRWSTIAGNDDDAVELEDTDFLSDVSNGDKFKIYPHTKLADVFPAGSLNLSMAASTVEDTPFGKVVTKKTQVGTFDAAGVGQNKTPTENYFFLGGHWRKEGDSLDASYDDAILRPDTYVLVRNADHDHSLKFLAKGHVPYEVRSIPVTNGVADDVLASSLRPVGVKLSQLDLGGTDAFVDSELESTPFGDVLTLGDVVGVFDSSAGTANPTPAAEYYYRDGHWRKRGEDLNDIFDDVEVRAGEGFILRKGGALGSGAAVWVNQAPYSQ